MTWVSPTRDHLNKHLHPEWIHSRMGPGGKKLFYLKSYGALKLANETFGRDGWTREIKSLVEDMCEVAEDGHVTVAMAAHVRVSLLKSGTYHEDTGYAIGEHEFSKEIAVRRARLKAGYDGMKRALRKFGNVMGNCLYNTTYLHHIEPSDPPSPLPPLPQQQQPSPPSTIQRPPPQPITNQQPQRPLLTHQQQQRPPPPPPVSLGKRSRYDEAPPQQPMTTRIKKEQAATATATASTIPPGNNNSSTANIKKEPIATINKHPPASSSSSYATEISRPTPLSLMTRTKPNLDTTASSSNSSSRSPPAPLPLPPASTKDTDRPILYSQDSFPLDEEDEALLVSITDAQLDVELLQRTCRENVHPPTTKSWSKITKSPSHHHHQ